MQNQETQLPWEEPDWLEQATDWMQARLAERGWQVTGPVEILHQRPWSAFARVPTDNGTAYFKAPAPAFKYEAALTQALAHWRPDCTAPLLAVDLERGWLLSAEAGDTLRSLGQSTAQIEHWLKVLPLYVELQMQMAEHMPELLLFGVFDQRLARLPDRYAQLLEDKESLLIGQKYGLAPQEYQQLRDLQPGLAEMCGQLAGYGLPETLTHEEVHENNVLFYGGRYIFTDWSDSCVAHPFFSILVTIRSVAHWLKLDEEGPEIKKIRDAYLEPWTKFEKRDKLLAAFELAYRLGMVSKSLTWHHGLAGLAKKHTEPYADTVPGWLQEFLNAKPPL